MNPTLCERDLLEILPYRERSPRAGDVVLFLSSDGEKFVVHRIVRVTPQGLRTRGDNNRLEDAHSLAAGDLIGQVVTAWRGRNRHPIRGGWVGLAQIQWTRSLRAVDRALSRLLHPLYHTLAASGLLSRLLPRTMRPRVVSFQAGDMLQLRLLWGRRAIGHFDPQVDQWRIRRPFRLLVDARSLPPHP